ncbi:recombinase family protein [Terribacillus sp. FSL K6-0262]|uniref:recombinase family protein n=1 Tax=Terribacillus sp. FSL K6-0262 TaxID=2921447 RepID=UPI0030ECE58C
MIHNAFRKGKVAIYTRVSSRGQSVAMQLKLAKNYVASNNLTNIEFFNDFAVSANKVEIKKRPELKKLLAQVEAGNISIVVVYSRDRLARNFYEYMNIIKLLNKHKVEVVFTAVEQSPYTVDVDSEGMHGIFTQMDGRNIANRSRDARKIRPTQVYGFERVITTKDKVKFIANKDSDFLRRLYESFIKSSDGLEVLKVIENFAAELRSKDYLRIMKYLRNPFFAGCADINGKLQRLDHVEELVSVADFNKVQFKLEKNRDIIYNALEEYSKENIIIPECAICKRSMSRRRTLSNPAVFYCRRKHKEITITRQALLEEVEVKLRSYVSNLNLKEVYKECNAVIVELQKQLNTLKNNKRIEVDKLHNKIVRNIMRDEISDNLLLSEKDLMNQIDEIDQQLIRLKEAKMELSDLAEIVRDHLKKRLQVTNTKILIQFFISSIEVSEDFIRMLCNFGDYVQEEIDNAAIIL